MTALGAKRDYGADKLDTTWTKASVPFLEISKGVEGPSGVVVTNNEAEFGYVKLNDIPIKTYYNEWLLRKEPQKKVVEYTVKPAEINAERTVIFTPERMDIMSNTALTRVISTALPTMALLRLPISSSAQKFTALQTEMPNTIEPIIERIFAAGNDEFFEDGMESGFSRSLTSAVKKHGNIAIEAISSLIIGEKVNPEVASEALRWIGDMEHPTTYASRLELLQRCLFCKSSWVRDGASIGLACLGDPKAIPYLEKTIKNEPYELIRRNMKLTIQDLSERGC